MANLPLIPGIETPPDLLMVDRQRVIGLTIEPGQLLLHRQQRQKRLGVIGDSHYIDPQRIFEEIEYVHGFLKKHAFSAIDVTDKPIETIADEVIRLMTGRFKIQDRPG